MKRLDVTIQSFLWGEKAIGKEGEIVAAIQAQRQHLHESPTRYTVRNCICMLCPQVPSHLLILNMCILVVDGCMGCTDQFAPRKLEARYEYDGQKEFG